MQSVNLTDSILLTKLKDQLEEIKVEFDALENATSQSLEEYEAISNKCIKLSRSIALYQRQKINKRTDNREIANC